MFAITSEGLVNSVQIYFNLIQRYISAQSRETGQVEHP